MRRALTALSRRGLDECVTRLSIGSRHQNPAPSVATSAPGIVRSGAVRANFLLSCSPLQPGPYAETVPTCILRPIGRPICTQLVATSPFASASESLAASPLLDYALLYQVLAETAPDAIIAIDDESTVLSINPAGERLSGYGASEIIGQSLTTLIPERQIGRAHV